MKLSVNYADAHVDLRIEPAGLAYYESSGIGCQFAGDPAINLEPISESYVAFHFDPATYPSEI